MELYQLRSFVAVAEEGHLTRAAERVHSSQPSVSAHVKALEEELGVALFVRTPKGMRLTEDGRVLKEYAVKALAAAEAISFQAQALRTDMTGPVRLGMNTNPDFLRARAFSTCMMRRHPGVYAHFIMTGTEHVARCLRDGEYDASYRFGMARNAPDIVCLPVCPTWLRIVGPAAWKERIGAMDLEGVAAEPWILTSCVCPFSELGKGFFRDNGLAPNVVVMADDEAIIRSLVAGGNGMSLLREDDALAAQANGEVFIWGDVRLETVLSFCYLRERQDERRMRAMLDVLAEVWELDPGLPDETCA
ncbi:MAG: LysR family transcriptional regulator [Desulfovibrionaceae bacterium]